MWTRYFRQRKDSVLAKNLLRLAKFGIWYDCSCTMFRTNIVQTELPLFVLHL
jgi:hypothetical protein